MNITNKQQLIDYMAWGNPIEFILFGGEGLAQQDVERRCFSQWYPASFEVNGNRFINSAHCVMAGKAKLFGDEESYQSLLAAGSDDEIQSLGRNISGFDEQLWLDNRIGIVEGSVEHKFAQNPELMNYLRDSGGKVVAEANPADKIWGTGVAEHDEAATQPTQWPGESLLGFVIMDVRRKLGVC